MLIYSIPAIGAIFIVVAIISKSILKKNGYKTGFWYGISSSEIKNMNELSQTKKDLRILYICMYISSIIVTGLFVFVIIVVISDIISRI